ncbi:DUF4192 domain-containing protein [Spirillospora albida]|uniref:DUF4192 domain-containing protein n=1 Tax=Spirillospora albida TaxID=58123 RepID=UPI00068D37CD|nr:DUF4192 domain-containing protein [Spirillospora albida]
MTTLVIRGPEDAIAAVPYMLGFHPSRSLVVIAFGGPESVCAVRVDLAVPNAERAAVVLGRNRFTEAVLLGYGTAPEVEPVAAATRTALAAGGVRTVEAIRVADGRWWSLTCRDPCCPPEGRPYDSTVTEVAAQATYAGHVVLRDRAELAASVQPLTGPARLAMRRATLRAERRHARLPAAQAVREGVALIPPLLAGPDRPTDDEVAWLGCLLTDLRVRDEAWTHMGPDAPDTVIAFWRDVLRRVEDRYAPAPASLLAMAAYTAGDGGLANVALERALAADPRYSMAILLRRVIDAGIPPSQVRVSMTSAELSAAYEREDRRAG